MPGTMSSEPKAETRVRKEAAVLSWGDLTDEQKQAGRQAHRLLIDMATSGETIDKPSAAFLPRLDKGRSSRVLLIDGGRGSGKTALLLTVLAHWRRAFEERPKDDGKATEEAERQKPDQIDPDKLARMLGGIVPIGLLDLHPLAPSTNLLMHVVGRFGRVVESLEGDGKSEKEPPAWHLAADGVLKSRKAWQKLLRAVAAAWDGGADQRRARLDLEAYTLELEEAERQRLELTTVFGDFVEALAEDFRKRARLANEKEKHLFVLAIDDADMNPARSVELLDMVRMLWHPQVAFLLTGDSELFEQTLAEHFLGELRRPLRHHGLVNEEVGSLAGQRQHVRLASEAYEKAIPPGHRCHVRPIPVGLRLEFAL